MDESTFLNQKEQIDQAKRPRLEMCQSSCPPLPMPQSCILPPAPEVAPARGTSADTYCRHNKLVYACKHSNAHPTLPFFSHTTFCTDPIPNKICSHIGPPKNHYSPARCSACSMMPCHNLSQSSPAEFAKKHAEHNPPSALSPLETVARRVQFSKIERRLDARIRHKNLMVDPVMVEKEDEKGIEVPDEEEGWCDVKDPREDVMAFGDGESMA